MAGPGAGGAGAAVGLRGATGGDDRGGEAEHRVVAVLEPGRAGVVRLAERADAPAAVGPDVAADGDGGVDVDEVAALARLPPPDEGDGVSALHQRARRHPHQAMVRSLAVARLVVR